MRELKGVHTAKTKRRELEGKRKSFKLQANREFLLTQL
jgi:hypothetical protein